MTTAATWHVLEHATIPRRATITLECYQCHSIQGLMHSFCFAFCTCLSGCFSYRSFVLTTRKAEPPASRGHGALCMARTVAPLANLTLVGFEESVQHPLTASP